MKRLLFYLFYCHRFNDSRNQYIGSIDIPMNLAVDRLLFVSPDLTDDQNKNLFLNVQKFIINSKRLIGLGNKLQEFILIPIHRNKFHL
jgi:hypothetical protein